MPDQKIARQPPVNVTTTLLAALLSRDAPSRPQKSVTPQQRRMQQSSWCLLRRLEGRHFRSQACSQITRPDLGDCMTVTASHCISICIGTQWSTALCVCLHWGLLILLGCTTLQYVLRRGHTVSQSRKPALMSISRKGDLCLCLQAACTFVCRLD